MEDNEGDPLIGAGLVELGQVHRRVIAGPAHIIHFQSLVGVIITPLTCWGNNYSTHLWGMRVTSQSVCIPLNVLSGRPESFIMRIWQTLWLHTHVYTC